MASTGLVLDEGQEQIEFLATSKETGGEFVRARVTAAPGRPAPPLHLHPRQEESFLVERGRLALRLGPETISVPAGERTTVPPATEHTFWNAGDEALVVVVEVRPALNFESFTETIHVLIRDGRLEPGRVPRNPLRLAVVAWAFREEWRLTRLPRPVLWLLPALAWLGRALGYPATASADGVPATV